MNIHRTAVLVSLTGGVAFFSQQVLLPVVSVYAEHLNFSALAIGILMASNSLLPALVGPTVGVWTSRWGHRQVVGAGGLMTALSTFFYLWGESYAVLLLAQLLSGFGWILVWISSQTGITQIARGEARERMVAAFTVYTAVGMAAGPLFGGLLRDQLGFDAAFIGFGSTGLLLMLLGYLTPGDLGVAHVPARAEAAAAADRGGAALPTSRELVSRPGIQVALGFSFVSLFAVGIRQSFVPVYLAVIGYSSTAIGVLLTVASICSVAVRPLTPYLLRVLGRGKLILFAMAGAIAGVALAPLFTSMIPLLILMALNGLGSGFHQPLGLVLIAEETEGAARGVAVGIRSAVNNLAVAVSPVVLGVAANVLGLASGFAVAGAVSAVLAGYVMRVNRRASSTQAVES